MASALPLVCLSLAVLAAAPLLAAGLVRRPALAVLLDNFVLVAVGGIVAVDVIPQSMERAGLIALAVAVVGLFLPIALHGVDERLRSRSGRRARDLVLLGVLLAGTAVHALFDGVALAGAALQPALALGVLLHRLPVGLALWVMVRPRIGLARTLLVVAALLLGTVAGALLGETGLPAASVPALALVQAFVAGSILHVVAETSPVAAVGPNSSSRWAGLAGAATAILTLVALHRLHDHAPDAATAIDVGDVFLALALRIAPAVLLSFLLVGALTALHAPGLPSVRAGRGRLLDAAAGVAAGLPHPLCSCTVAPLYAALVERRASPAAARAFLVATPELGVPAVLLSARLSGLAFMATRVVGAAAVAWIVGIVGISAADGGAGVPRSASENPPAPLGERLRHGMRHALLDAVDHVGPWLVLGLGVASLLQQALGDGALHSVPPALQTVLFAVGSLPLYLCAAGSTPVAAVLLQKGASVGAVLAFLLVGPATSLSTLALLDRLHGRRSARAFAFVLVGAATTVGLVVNAITSAADLAWRAPLDFGAPHTPSAMELGSLVVLVVLLIVSLGRQGVRGFLVQIMSPQHDHQDAHDHAHGPGCFHDHGPPVAPPFAGLGHGDKRIARVTLPFDPRAPRAPPEDEP